jgi:hypothetical protein
VITGDDDGVEVVEQADLVELAACVRGLRVGDQRQRVALTQNIEDLAHVGIEPEPVAANARATSRSGTTASVELRGRQRPSESVM